MIKIKNLTLNNFGPFDTEQKIDLENKEGLIQIIGQNILTGGSSGAGKSTIFHAIDYLFGVNEIPSVALQTRNSKSEMVVSVELTVDNIDYVINRSKKHGLSIHSVKENVSGDNKLAEELLDKLIGIPRDLFKRLIHKKQKEGGFFLNLTPKKKYEFVTKCSGLEDINNKQVLIQDDISKLESSKNTFLKEIDYLKNNKNTIENLFKSYKEPQVPNIEKPNTELLTEYENKLKLLINSEKLELDQIEQEQPPTKTVFKIENITELKHQINIQKNIIDGDLVKHKQYIYELNKEIESIESKINNLETLKQKLKNKTQELIAINEQIKSIQNHTCPTCSQVWQNDKSTNTLSELKQKQMEFSKFIIENKTIVEEIPLLKNSLTEKKDFIDLERNKEISVVEKQKLTLLHTQLVHLEYEKQKHDTVENERIVNFNNNQSVKKTLIKDKYRSSVELLKHNINDIKNKEFLYKNSNEQYLQQLSDYKNNLEMSNKEINNIENKLQELENKIIKIDKDLKICEEAKNTVKTYIMQTFYDSLDYISSIASSLLSNIPNMSSTTLFFDIQKETKSGSIKDEIQLVINNNGTEITNYKTLSGGESTAIELAVDLAVLEMIENRTSKSIDLFILDEPFTGLDSVNIMSILELFNTLSLNKKIIIVDHNPEINQMIDQKIIVQKNQDTSIIL